MPLPHRCLTKWPASHPSAPGESSLTPHPVFTKSDSHHLRPQIPWDSKHLPSAPPLGASVSCHSGFFLSSSLSLSLFLICCHDLKRLLPVYIPCSSLAGSHPPRLAAVSTTSVCPSLWLPSCWVSNLGLLILDHFLSVLKKHKPKAQDWVGAGSRA